MLLARVMILTSEGGWGQQSGAHNFSFQVGGGGVATMPAVAATTQNIIKLKEKLCVGIFWPVHLPEASLGRMLCTSCIFVTLLELTLAAFFYFSTFVVFRHCVLLRVHCLQMWCYRCGCLCLGIVHTVTTVCP